MNKTNVMLGVSLGMVLLIGILLVFVKPTNAGELTAEAVVTSSKVITASTPVYLKEDFNTKYGTIAIADKLTNPIIEYSLINNTEQCLINCEAYGKAVLYSDGKLFEGKEFISSIGTEILSNSQFWIKVTDSYQVEDNVYKEVCAELKNTTKQCTYEVVEYKNKTEYNSYWENYNYEVLKAGNYEWKLTATKGIKQNIDFQLVSNGQTLKQWAWWNGSWTKNKEIKIKENSGVSLSNYTTLVTVTYDADMQTDFDDLRFISGDNTTELSYWIQNKSDSTSANVWIEVPTLTANVNNTVYMYYNNPSVSTTGSKASAFANALNESNGKSFSNSDTASSYANSRGFLMTSQKKILLLGIYNVNNEVTCNTYGYWEGTTNSVNYSVSGGNAQTMKLIPASTAFYLLPFTPGTTCTSKYGSFGGYPLTQTNIQWTNGDAFYSNAHHTDANGFNIGSLWTDERVATEPTVYFGDEGDKPVECNFSGYVKDASSNGLQNAKIVVFNQDLKTETYNTTTSATGYWSINITNSTKNFTAVAYLNNSLIGQAKPFIRGTC
jgi:hypothetical protein